MTERWVPVPGFPGYEVSDLGHVRSWRRNGASKALAKEPRQKRPTTDRDGYPRVTLHFRGKSKRFVLSRLVLEVFVGPCPPGHEARHVHDRDPANCRLDNLEWATHTTNIRDKYTHGTMPRGDTHWITKNRHLMPRGSKCPQAKLTEHTVREILRSSESGSAIAGRLGVSISTVSKVRTGKNWRHVYEQETG